MCEWVCVCVHAGIRWILNCLREQGARQSIYINDTVQLIHGLQLKQELVLLLFPTDYSIILLTTSVQDPVQVPAVFTFKNTVSVGMHVGNIYLIYIYIYVCVYMISYLARIVNFWCDHLQSAFHLHIRCYSFTVDATHQKVIGGYLRSSRRCCWDFVEPGDKGNKNPAAISYF